MGESLRLGPLQRGHRNRIREILDATAVFRREEIDVALELFDDTFAFSAQGVGPAATSWIAPEVRTPDYEFVGAFDGDGQLAGYACYGPTSGADHTFDLYWIAMHPDAQGNGGGSTLMSEVERRLAARGARLIVVETSSRGEYAPTRRFYEGRGYASAACVRDFYAPGDDRLVFTKRFS
jgi:ribosomal protein S18 acetylase RimI-like enzyme